MVSSGYVFLRVNMPGPMYERREYEKANRMQGRHIGGSVYSGDHRGVARVLSAGIANEPAVPVGPCGNVNTSSNGSSFSRKHNATGAAACSQRTA